MTATASEAPVLKHRSTRGGRGGRGGDDRHGSQEGPACLGPGIRYQDRYWPETRQARPAIFAESSRPLGHRGGDLPMSGAHPRRRGQGL